MATKLNNQKGLTLIEVLAGVVLFSIIGTVLYFVLFNSISTENKIRTETYIRDEADFVMSRLVAELYPLEAAKMKNSDPLGTYIQYKNGSKETTVSFKNGGAYINDSLISSSDFNLTGSTIILDDRSVKISLKASSNKNKSASALELESQFGLLEGLK